MLRCIPWNILFLALNFLSLTQILGRKTRYLTDGSLTGCTQWDQSADVRDAQQDDPYGLQHHRAQKWDHASACSMLKCLQFSSDISNWKWYPLQVSLFSKLVHNEARVSLFSDYSDSLSSICINLISFSPSPDRYCRSSVVHKMTRNRFKVATIVQIVLVLMPAALRHTLAYPLEEFVLRYERQDRMLGTTDGNSSSSLELVPYEICTEEIELCQGDPVCVRCGTNSTPIAKEECVDRYPVLNSTNITECADLEALIWCKFDLIGEDVCRTHELTLDFWACALGSRGCNDTLPCSVGSSYTPPPTTTPSGLPTDTLYPTLEPTCQQGTSRSGFPHPTSSPALPTDVGSAINGAMGVPHPGSNGIVLYASVIAFWIGVQAVFTRTT